MNEEELKRALKGIIEPQLRENFIKGTVTGFEVANVMLLKYSRTHTKKQLEDFLKKNIQNKDVIGRAIRKDYE